MTMKIKHLHTCTHTHMHTHTHTHTLTHSHRRVRGPKRLQKCMPRWPLATLRTAAMQWRMPYYRQSVQRTQLALFYIVHLKIETSHNAWVAKSSPEIGDHKLQPFLWSGQLLWLHNHAWTNLHTAITSWISGVCECHLCMALTWSDIYAWPSPEVTSMHGPHLKWPQSLCVIFAVCKSTVNGLVLWDGCHGIVKHFVSHCWLAAARMLQSANCTEICSTPKVSWSVVYLQ